MMESWNHSQTQNPRESRRDYSLNYSIAAEVKALNYLKWFLDMVMKMVWRWLRYFILRMVLQRIRML